MQEGRSCAPESGEHWRSEFKKRLGREYFRLVVSEI